MRDDTGRLVGDETEMAELFKDYFASTMTQKQLPAIERIYLGSEEGLLSLKCFPRMSRETKGTAS